MSTGRLTCGAATVHHPAVSSLVGPTHGCAYLFVIILTARHGQATAPIQATAVIPGIGGLLALRQLQLTGTRPPRGA